MHLHEPAKFSAHFLNLSQIYSFRCNTFYSFCHWVDRKSLLKRITTSMCFQYNFFTFPCRIKRKVLFLHHLFIGKQMKVCVKDIVC